MAADSKKIAKDIIPCLGDKDNIVSVVHCTTRLRFVLKDYQLVKLDALKKSYGVISAFNKGGYMQVVIGNKVADVHKEVVLLLSGDGGASQLGLSSDNAADKPKEKFSFKTFNYGKFFKGLPSRFISTCSAVFTPVMLLIAAAGILWGLYNIFTVTGLVKENSDFAVMWGIMADAPLFFLPILLGFSAGKKFGANPYLMATIGAALVYPDMISRAGSELVIWGVHFKILSYAKSVLPILFATYFASLLEKLLNKYLPLVLRSFLTPMLVIMIMVPLTIGILGPVFTIISDGLANGYSYIPNWLAGLIVGGFWQLVVMFGFHHAFNAIDRVNINAKGFSPLWSLREMSVSSQTGAAFGVYLKMKDKKKKSLTLAMVATGVFGVSEPLLYGVTLPRKKVFLLGAIGGAIGGFLCGIIGGGIFIEGGWGVLSLLSAIDRNGLQGQAFGAAFFGVLIGMVASFVISTLLVVFFYKEPLLVEDGKESEENATDSVKSSLATSADNNDTKDLTTVDNTQNEEEKDFVTNQTLTLLSPLKGKAILQKDASDPAFASQDMGKGMIIIPSEGKLYAPCDGVVAVVFATKHMVAIKADNGAEVMMHIGIDTVQLNGKYYETFVNVGDRVTAGTHLVSFDIEKISAEGYSMETPILIINASQFENIKIQSMDQVEVEVGEKIIEL